MKISYNWLKEFTGLDKYPEELSEILTACGLEVEAMEYIGADPVRLKGVVTGLVVEKEKHPDADRLSLTKVDTGDGNLLNIVCGAANVAKGQKVLVATVGTKIVSPKGTFVIQKSKIRGQESEGMICAEDELGLGDSHEGIMVLPKDTPVGIQAFELYANTSDIVYEIGLTPNRSDAASHIGVARDVIAVHNCRYGSEKTIILPQIDAFSVDDHRLNIKVEVLDTEACPRYSGVSISGIRVASSPEWLKNRLKAIGVRPLNNIVDITNYVLFETGQPLHAFDAQKISGGKVVVKKLPSETSFVTLDGVERKLSPEDLMICNDSEPMCIAGVFGGMHAGVNEKTTDVFIESAYFSPSGIRKTSKRHGLKTDASFRFERGCDPAATIYALKRAALLIKEIAGGKIASEIVDVYPLSIEPVKLKFSYHNLAMTAGKHIDNETVKNILRSLDIEYSEVDQNNLILTIPTAKTDVIREIDVIEEIMRIYGYDNIDFSEYIRSPLKNSPVPDPEVVRNVVSDYLSAQGFYEIMNNSLSSSAYYNTNPCLVNNSKPVMIHNPISRELDCMRLSMVFGGLESIAFNKNRKAHDIRFYEWGKVYSVEEKVSDDPLQKYNEKEQLVFFVSGLAGNESWNAKPPKADFYYLKSLIHQVFERTGIDFKQFEVKEQAEGGECSKGLAYYFNSRHLCSFGALKPELCRQFDIKDDVFFGYIEIETFMQLIALNKVQYKPVARYPEVRRDLALLLNYTVKFSDIEKIAFETGQDLLKRVTLFDIFEDKSLGDDKKSYALSFVLQDDEATLTDERIDAMMKKLAEAFSIKLGAILR